MDQNDSLQPAIASRVTSLLGLVHARAASLGDATAFARTDSTTTLTFRDVARKTTEMLLLLRHNAVRRGDVIAWFSDGDPNFLPMLTACAAVGARLAPLNPALHRHDIRTIMTHCHPRIVIARTGAPVSEPDRWLAGFKEATLFAETEWQAAASTMRADVTAERESAYPASEPCLILHTPGVTGSPKPTLLSSANLVSAAEAFLARYPLQPDDVLLSMSPAFTAAGAMLGAIIGFAAGAQSVAAASRNDFDSAALWADVADHRVTVCEATASLLEALLRDDTMPAAPLPPRVKRFLCGGAPLAEDVWRRFEARFGRPVEHGYGLTETTFWVAGTLPGPAGDITRFRLQKLAGCDISLRPLAGKFHATEIIVRGPMVTQGYHKRENITHTAFDHGFFRTGDVGRMEPDGSVVVSGRLRELFTRDATPVAAGEVDHILSRHPDVVESRTFFDASAPRGEQLIAVCVTAEKASDIEAWLLSQPDIGKLHPRVRVACTLPRSPSGQVLTHALHLMVSGELENKIFTALTARKFRRNPPFDEAALRSRIQAAIMTGAPLEFLMFWGCGARVQRSPADLGALAALHELMEEPKRLPHITTRVHVIFTDLHAAANGHSPAHRSGYFAEMEDAAGDLDAVFERESEVWARHGLTEAAVAAFEQTDAFEDYWQNFPLRDKFIEQATRHSAQVDSAAAGRHYLATCRMERVMLERAYPEAIFLTYNGPEFNECFPALPTLYVYPGHRGRTVKPWFIEA